MIDRYTWPGCLPGYVPMGPALAGQSALASGVGNESVDCADEKPPQLSVVPRPAFAASFDDEVTD